MLYTTDDLQIVEPVAHVRSHPEIYLACNKASPIAILSRLIADILLVDKRAATVVHMDGWWIVGSPTDWMVTGSAISVRDYFFNVVPYPEGGQNAFHPEILTTAFADVVVTLGRDSVEIIKGQVIDETPYISMKKNVEWSRLVAFRMS